ncbi:hypothetical protein MTR_7g103040 [Medicago truncatula]|uniref:RNase H type-1 domain-containing protein n=1 Tax=Medicago truncatula TaxID=3880 RepID=A0A072U2Z1_MEDTR|nr:hypothetical protein MTR_7g103040 [Medicago truncatula]
MRYKTTSYVNDNDVNAKQQITVSWTLPQSDWDKINSDGMCQGDGGEWLCGFSKFLKSLRLTQRYGFSKVEVHADCKVVVKNLTRDGVVGVAGFQLVQKFR